MKLKALTSNPDGLVTDVSQDEGELMIRRGVAEAVPETAPSVAKSPKAPKRSKE